MTKPYRRHVPRWARDRCSARTRRGSRCPWLTVRPSGFCVHHERQAERRQEAAHRAAWRVLACLVGDRVFPSGRLLHEQRRLRQALLGRP